MGGRSTREASPGRSKASPSPMAKRVREVVSVWPYENGPLCSCESGLIESGDHCQCLRLCCVHHHTAAFGLPLVQNTSVNTTSLAFLMWSMRSCQLDMYKRFPTYTIFRLPEGAAANGEWGEKRESEYSHRLKRRGRGRGEEERETSPWI